MECEETYLLITEFVERDLGEREREMFELHVKKCINCKAFFRTYEKTQDIVSRLLCDDMPPEIAQKVKKYIDEIIKKRNNDG